MKFLLRLFYGADLLVESFTRLMEARTKATAVHAANAVLKAQLTAGEAELADLKGEYAAARQQLEAAYLLELE